MPPLQPGQSSPPQSQPEPDSWKPLDFAYLVRGQGSLPGFLGLGDPLVNNQILFGFPTLNVNTFDAAGWVLTTVPEGTTDRITVGHFMPPPPQFTVLEPILKTGWYRAYIKTLLIPVLNAPVARNSIRCDLINRFTIPDPFQTIDKRSVEMRMDNSAANVGWRTVENESFVFMEKGQQLQVEGFINAITGSWQYWGGATFIQVSLAAR